MHYEKNQQEVQEIDEKQDKLFARHKEINQKYRGKVSKEKITILEQDIDLLWEKVCVYDKYAAEERNLRVKAVEAFRKHETRMFGSVKRL